MRKQVCELAKTVELEDLRKRSAGSSDGNGIVFIVWVRPSDVSVDYGLSRHGERVGSGSACDKAVIFRSGRCKASLTAMRERPLRIYFPSCVLTASSFDPPSPPPDPDSTITSSFSTGTNFIQFLCYHLIQVKRGKVRGKVTRRL